MPSTKCEGLSYPTYFLKSRGSVIRNNFLEYTTKQATLLARRNDVYALFATNKAKNILNRHFSCFCSDTMYSKSIKKNRKSQIFESLSFLYYSTFSECKGSSLASSDRKIYFNKKLVGIKSLICQIMIANKVPNFPSLFSKYFA